MTIKTTKEQLIDLGAHLKKQLGEFINDRSPLEVQWMKNLRQHQAKYDPDVLNRIPDERSKAYPDDTRVKVDGGVAKMMEMMFPSLEKNWELSVSPNPSIPKEDLQSIIESLQAQAVETGAPVASEDIERAVRSFADGRKDKMETEIADQLADPGIDYPQLCKKVVRSGYIYGFGVARSPMVRTQKERVWVLDEDTGEYKAKEKTLRRPYPEHVRIWDFYPDLSALAWVEQEITFERIVLSRHDFSELKKRPDFLKEAIKGYLRDNPSGNYTAQSYETELHTIANTSNLSDRTARRYEVYRALGFISAHTLEKVGVEVAEDELDQDIFADMWFINDTVIKADRAAFGSRPSEQYQAFIYAEDDDTGLTGKGLPEKIRNSQMSICACTRALMDNVAAIAGPIFEVNVNLLPPKRRAIGAIHAFMTIEREGDGAEASYPAVRDIHTTSHVDEILKVIAMHRQQLDIESNLPAFTMGGIQEPLGEAFRTSGNMSMMMGGANMLTKDTVRAFDKFTTGVINSMLSWNMEFNEKEEIKGDYQVVAKGNISLVTKEVRGAALDQFVTTLTPEERAILDTYGLLVDRLESRDLPTDRLLPEDDANAVLQGMKEAASQASQTEQGLTAAKTEGLAATAEGKRLDTQVTAASADATIQEILSRVDVNLANAKSSEDKMQLENLRTLLTTVAKPTQQGGGAE
jgi:hypothetical protein